MEKLPGVARIRLDGSHVREGRNRSAARRTLIATTHRGDYPR